MAKLIQKLVLILMIPLVTALVIYQIDRRLLDPSSDKSIFAFFYTGQQAKEDTQISFAGKDSPSQLLNLIWTTFALNDSLFSVPRKGVRDPMKPLVALGAEANIRKRIKPTRALRFPLSIADISAIIWNPRTPTVLIRGKRYWVGSKVAGATITAINRSSVEFFWRDKSYTLERSAPKINVQ